jgi:hypothetical protein
VGREGATGFRVKVLCQQPIVPAVGKAFFYFSLRQPSPTAAVLKLLAKTPLPTASQGYWERIFAFLFFFSFNFFWVLPTITTSQFQNLGMF